MGVGKVESTHSISMELDSSIRPGDLLLVQIYFDELHLNQLSEFSSWKTKSNLYIFLYGTDFQAHFNLDLGKNHFGHFG